MTPDSPHHNYLVATFDVTGLDPRERDALAFEIAVQAEESSFVGEDEHGWQGHRSVDEPRIHLRSAEQVLGSLVAAHENDKRVSPQYLAGLRDALYAITDMSREEN